MEFPRVKLDQEGRQEAQAVLEHLAGNEDDLEAAIYELVYLRHALKQAVEALVAPDTIPNLFWNSIEDHLQYAKEIGSNFVGRPGPKWTAFALAEEVQRLRVQVSARDEALEESIEALGPYATDEEPEGWAPIVAITKAKAALAGNPDQVLYRHVKTGNSYRLIKQGMDCTNSRDGLRVAIYCRDGEPEKTFVRDLAEFHQKFEKLT